MSLYTSTQFASCAATGTDWRDTSKQILEQLQSVKTAGSHFNLGFLYISDSLVDDATSILNLFRSVLDIEDWVGTVGIGVCGCGEEFIDKPAISVMIGQFEADSFCLFPSVGLDKAEAEDALQPWLNDNEPMLTLVHGDPMAEEDPAHTLKDVEQITGGFLIGGLSSSRSEHVQIAGDLCENGICGAVFSQNVKVVTALSQGCTPIGPVHTITRGSDHQVSELDSKKALEVFEDDLRTMSIKKIDRDPDLIMTGEEAQQNPDALPEEFQSLFKGEVHAAFPVSESDQNDYLVRNIITLEPDDGSVVISQIVGTGDRLMFVHRDDNTVQQDLSKSVVKLRERIQKETGAFEPKGAIYVSCVARAFSQDEGSPESEMKLIRDIIGDVPLAGFYAGGEISNARLYGYTGILTLFL